MRKEMKKYICLLLFSLFAVVMFGQQSYDHRLISAIDVGVYDSPFSFTDTRYTGDYADDFHWSHPVPPVMETKDIFYRLTLTRSLDVKVAPSWSGSQYLLVYLLDASGNCLRASVSGVMFSLLPGVYYLVIEPEPSFSPEIMVSDGNIRTQITGSSRTTGEDFFHPFELGTFESDFHITPRVNPMDEYIMDYYPTGDSERDRLRHDAVFRFTLEKPMQMSMDNYGTRYVSQKNYYESKLLNAYGDTLATRRDSYPDARLFKLPAGTYFLYVWAEIRSFASSNEIVVRLNGTVDESGGTSGDLGNPEVIHGYPHLITRIPMVETVDISLLEDESLFQEIQYFDHLGQLAETVQQGVTPEGNDLVTLHEYDGFGKITKEWLPVAVSGSNGSCLHPFYLHKVARLTDLYGQDPYPYSETSYDGSPLHRISNQFGAGVEWQSMFRPVRTDYLTNIDYGMNELKVRVYRCTDTSLICSGNYANGDLYGTKTTDEDGNVSYEFKDKAGRVVLSRQMNGSQSHDTYYVYDGYGNIRFVLPPLAADNLNGVSSWSESNESLKKYAYMYRYDSYNRCIYKKLPGCEPIYTVYDGADRPVFTQDGKQRDKGEWSFSISDVFNRVVLTGVCKNTLDYAADPLNSQVVKATFEGVTGATKGYMISGVTLNAPVALSVSYYDTYGFIGQNGIPSGMGTAYEAATGYGNRYAGGCKGQQTGTLTARLSKAGIVTGYLYSVMYYDERYRVVQQRGNNELNGTIQVYTAYSFTGKPTQVKQVCTVPGKDAITELYNYSYDHADRLLRTTYQLNNDAVVTLVDNIYDETGRLITDKRNGNAKLKTNYAYNVRSWMKGISGLLFSQTLNYQEAIPGNTSCYNGNISRMSWKSGDETIESGYRFTYDGLSRLKDAIYGEGSYLASNMNRFNEQITGYDKLGNILGLKRYGQISASNYGLIDDLTLTYNGNQLQSVQDDATYPVYGNGMEFKDGANQSVEYLYDKNGNLHKDLNKNIYAIEYNLLNLPSQVIFVDGNVIEYEYGSDGRKLRTAHVINGVTSITDYCGNAIYEDGSLKMLLNSAGYMSFPDKKFHFYLKDHLGNVRVVADRDGNVKEANSYYPFGGLFTTAADIQPYKFNGKELDRKNGLDWYDYGARMYDAVLGRWHAVDPMSEKYYSWSPYTYCKNNPVLRIDLDGKDDYVISRSGRLFNKTPIGMRGKSSTDNLYLSSDRSIAVTVNQGLLGEMYSMQAKEWEDNQVKKSYGSTQDLEAAATVFKFAADHTTVEWKLDVYDDNGAKTVIVATDQNPYGVDNGANAQNKLSVKGEKVIDIHSHLSGGTKGGAGNDFNLAKPQRKNAVYMKDNRVSTDKKGMIYEYTQNASRVNSIRVYDATDLFQYIKRK